MTESLKPGGTIRPRSDAGRRHPRTAACLIVALDGLHPRDPPSRHWLIDVDEVWLRRCAGDRVHERASARTLILRLPDGMISARHAVIHCERGQWTLRDDGSLNGTMVGGERTRERRLLDGDVIQLGHFALVFRESELPGPPVRLDERAGELASAQLPRGLWTLSPALEREHRATVTMASTTASVAILGETGTGKELTARAIHDLSRRGGAFVAVNCAEIPEPLVASEMFGYRKGAHNQADSDKEGLVAASHNGTLFLDEIGDMPLAAQATLLRTLQDGVVRPLGATRNHKVDLRVVCATHVDVPALVRAGRFREDLWSRLIGHTVRLPPLRDRLEDLGLLIADTGAREARPPRQAPTLSHDAVSALLAHDWPRNIRQLHQVMARAVALAPDGPISTHELPDELRAQPGEGKARLIELLHRHRGNLVAVAKDEGVSRQAIEKRCRKLDLDYKAFREGGPAPLADAGAGRTTDDR